jgi:D-lactate dehydrogenase
VCREVEGKLIADPTGEIWALDVNDDERPETAIKAAGYKAISIFSGDDASSLVLEKLSEMGVKYITLRSAGYNNIHLKAAEKYGIQIANTPDYSPEAIAEHAAGLLLVFNRKINIADEQVHRYDFRQRGLMGFNLHGKTIGIIGTGRIGTAMVRIMHGFGGHILACDPNPDYDLAKQYQLTYTSLESLCKKSDIISLHIPLTLENHYLINAKLLASMKEGVVLINTSRGAVVETKALIDHLETGRMGGYCTDVYENEKGIFFRDNSDTGIRDGKLIKLLSFPNVLLTPHQAYLTTEALSQLAEITFENINSWSEGRTCKNQLKSEIILS